LAIESAQPTPAAVKLGKRLRRLREGAPVRLTQIELGEALRDDGEPISPASISVWENASSGRIPPVQRLEAYARLFCTPRSFESGVRMLALAELTTQELAKFDELRLELVDLRERVAQPADADTVPEAQSMWHFPDGSQITLACYRLPDDRRPPSADPSSLDYLRFSGLADLDTLIEIYGAVKSYNPRSRVVITAAQDLTLRDVSNHLVLIGGAAWHTATRWFTRIFPMPIESSDPGDRGAIVVHQPGGDDLEFKYTLDNGELIEDVGYFARGENPSAPKRTLTICGGITTRGVLGSARCFIDAEMQERNEQYLWPRFPDGSAYCVVMRVPVVNTYPLTPDLSKPENRLFEWHNADPAVR
jgi:transcriptional regulator with XRE-family HTH domain